MTVQAVDSLEPDSGGASARRVIRVRGNASAEELAAVLAALRRPVTGPPEVTSGYERWRRQRLAARADGRLAVEQPDPPRRVRRWRR